MAAAPTHTGGDVDEAEAALYDRQIRLWGLEAQNRMRRSHILLAGLGGVATEALKNIVLAGVGRVSLLDDAPVQPGDLEAGFFWREDDVGNARAACALPRVQALNPLVKVDVLHGPLLEGAHEDVAARLAELGVAVLVVSAELAHDRTRLIQLNDLCRTLSLKYYVSAAQGFGGYIFSDLGPRHEYIVERPVASTSAAPAPLAATTSSSADPTAAAAAAAAPAEATSAQPEKVQIKKRQAFVTLQEALRTKWKGKKGKRMSPGVFATWALWEHTSRPSGSSEQPPSPEELHKTCLTILDAAGVPSSVLTAGGEPDEVSFFTSFLRSQTTHGDFSPTCAIIGGVLAQDILNALGGREEPLCNWFQLDGLAGKGPVHDIGTPPSDVIPAAAVAAPA
ncbi:hypothetical protein FA09DRAFT_346764 [Tilletiopsis washingtonensis]|uniref:THIF-type NAD/FAD binding fold domain-containing protein n=1 Tax=Tilletiopsis washingtonensis TaxID=58919 RepID=A0A316Z5A6_9BASI|nr:hypothetical protein FA09DRAFT_346764 [Tilletiopsis washingtonensis]PWN96142.1 hypothetical protein FA09DRAFT_346764 [Tilletiopsis washingtonensis]